MIETERLLLRKPRADDAPTSRLPTPIPRRVRYIGDGSTATLTERRERDPALARPLGERGASGSSRSSVAGTARVLGRAGFVRWDPETWEIGGSETELGWMLAREHWGHGYATEAALALRDWALGERGLTRLISLVQHGNMRSFRVAEKLGERYERDVEVRGKPSRLYSVER